MRLLGNLKKQEMCDKRAKGRKSSESVGTEEAVGRARKRARSSPRKSVRR
jgi:hypothetical protein